MPVVAALIIYTVYRVFFAGLGSHVVEEVLERFIPTLANSDASSPVAIVVGVVFVVATASHVFPRAILTPKFVHKLRLAIYLQASATFSVEGSQTVGVGCVCITALAFAKPITFTNVELNNQPAYFPASEVDKLAMIGKRLRCIFRCSHDELLGGKGPFWLGYAELPNSAYLPLLYSKNSLEASYFQSNQRAA